jgi:hypothetical protein
MEATSFRSLLRLLRIHFIAVVWFAAELTHRAGFACGVALRPLRAQRATEPGATGADLQLEAVISG